MNESQSRRRFLEIASIAAAGVVVGKNSVVAAPAYIKDLRKPRSVFKGVQIGVITYSFRSMPGDVESIVRYCKECGVNAVELMGDAVEDFAGAPKDAKMLTAWRLKTEMAKFKPVKKLFDDAGINIYAFKPRNFGVESSDAEFDYAFKVAKTLGASHVTMEFPEDRAQTKRIGNIAARNRMVMGYHGHLQQTFEMWDDAVKESKGNAINVDMGHYVAAGFDPIPFITAKHDHIVSMHVKDRKSKENGGANMPWGEGDTPIPEALQLMSKSKYRFPATIELEYDIPPGSDAVKEVAKCLEFAKNALGA